MRRLSLFITSLFIFTLSIYTPVSAASPSASLILSPNKRYATLSFSGLKAVSRVSYVLTYNTNGRNTGLEGGFRPTTKTSRSSRRQILGTCSTRFCTYHKNPKNLSLEVTFTLRSGGKTVVKRSLP